MTREKKKIIIFDVDGTLAKLNSWVLFSQLLADHHGLEGEQKEELVKQHYLLYKKFREFIEQNNSTQEILNEEWIEVQQKLFRIWSLNGKKPLTPAILEIIVQKIVEDFVTDELKSLFDSLKNQGYVIYLVSASFTEFVEALAIELEVEGFANSRFDLSDPNDPKLKYHPDEDGRKLGQILNIIEKNEINLDEDEVWVIDDKPGIELVQKKIAKMILIGTDEQNEFIHAVIQGIEELLDLLDRQ